MGFFDKRQKTGKNQMPFFSHPLSFSNRLISDVFDIRKRFSLLDSISRFSRYFAILIFSNFIVSCISKDQPLIPLPTRIVFDQVDIEEPDIVSEEERIAGLPDGIPPENVIIDRTVDEQGRTVRTRFYANELVRERVTVQGVPMFRISLRGNATVEHEGVVIRAPRMSIDGGRIGRIEGGVTVIDRENGVTIRASRADYDRDEQTVIVTGNPYLLSRQEGTAPTLITTNRMVRQLSDNITYLEGDVRIINEGWTILADRGTHTDSDNRILLESHPVIFGEGMFLTGDILEYRVSEKQIIMDRRVFFQSNTADFSFDPSEDSSNRFDNSDTQQAHQAQANSAVPMDFSGLDSETLSELLPDVRAQIQADSAARQEAREQVERDSLQTITADRLVHDFSNSPALTMLSGNVYMTGDGMYMKTTYLEAVGSDFHEIRTDETIEYLDRYEGLRIEAGNMNYNRRTDLLRLTSSPRMYFLREGTDEVTGTMKAAVIERYIGSGLTTAFGNIRIDQQETEARGETAVYNESEGLLILEGEPALKREGGWIQSERIMVYPQTNRVLFERRIRGFVLEDQNTLP